MKQCKTCLFRDANKNCTNAGMLLTLYTPRVGDTFACDRHETLPEPTPLPEEPEEVQVVLLERADVTVQQLCELLQTLVLEGKGHWEIVYENDYGFCNVDRIVSFPIKKEILLH